MGDNLQNFCRVCLDMESDHVSILDDPSIHLQMKSCLSIVVTSNDYLPKFICKSCTVQLSDFYNFQLNARCSQDWLESCLKKGKKSSEAKTPIQPLPDSEYNSDSLLEFLNSTANIDDYLNNLGKEDIPSIVNMLDRHGENSVDCLGKVISYKNLKSISPKKKDGNINSDDLEMEIDVLDSDIEIVNEILMKKSEITCKRVATKERISCYGCKVEFDDLQKISFHISICDNALRTCKNCLKMFDSRQKMLHHEATHYSLPKSMCHCGEKFLTQDRLFQHKRICESTNNCNLNCMFRCKQCKEVFKNRHLLYKHVKDHLYQSDKKICDVCGHICLGDKILADHKKKEHNKSMDTKYRCKVCQFTSKNHMEIYLHAYKHINKMANHHLCEMCGKSFSTHTTLGRHKKQHKQSHEEKCKVINGEVIQDVEPVMCERCGLHVNSLTINSHSCGIG